jgi:galactokinase
MYRIVHGTNHNLPDVTNFIELLNNLENNPSPELRELFDLQNEIIVTRAPGRLDVMGGIADYSGSLVLEMPIREATLVALQKDTNRTLKIVSLSENAVGNSIYEMPLADFERDGKPVEYEDARGYFQQNADNHWAAYPAGIFFVLMRECQINL